MFSDMFLSSFTKEIEKQNYNEKYKKEEKERFKKINSCKVDKSIYEYLKNNFTNLKIEILGDYSGNIIELMENGKLEGWCWQTTETAILFLDDYSYLKRGYLKFSDKTNYYHSWIQFNFENEEYIFDPCLNIISSKNDYYSIFEINEIASINSKEIKEYFINYVNNYHKKDHSNENIFKDIFSNEMLSEKNKEVLIFGNNDPNSPMYRNCVGYKTDLENGKIKKIVAHYYLNG